MEITKVFQCKMCGQCCEGQGGIVVTQPEIERIEKFLNMNHEEFQKKFLEPEVTNKYSIRTKEDGYCIFFDKNKGCLVHPVKPNICLAWPFFKGNLEDKNSLEMAKEYCPGINKNIDFEEFKKQGIRYLQEKKLLCHKKDGPNALFLKF